MWIVRYINMYYYYYLDAGRIPLNINIDHSKAFDTLDHTILLEKLWHYGIRDTELQLTNNYLSNR